jgi:stearoyl-CoA desaturase (delta-9 desaturase)
MPAPQPEQLEQRTARSTNYLTVGSIFLLHLMPVIALILGTNSEDWLFFCIVYPFSAIGVGVAAHRYFAHRAFRTSRWFQFLLALMATSAFGNPVRFAGKHRLHHLHVDTDRDVHSPSQGFWYCWMGSLVSPQYPAEESDRYARDWLRYPELRWLNKYYWLPGMLLILLAFSLGGIGMVGIGVCLGPVILMHQSSAVNYLCHKYGYRRYASTNNPIVALLTFGEGWHNNHHEHPTSPRAGEVWWELDIFYYVIQLFQLLGLVWQEKRNHT